MIPLALRVEEVFPMLSVNSIPESLDYVGRGDKDKGVVGLD